MLDEHSSTPAPHLVSPGEYTQNPLSLSLLFAVPRGRLVAAPGASQTTPPNRATRARTAVSSTPPRVTHQPSKQQLFLSGQGLEVRKMHLNVRKSDLYIVF